MDTITYRNIETGETLEFADPQPIFDTHHQWVRDEADSEPEPAADESAQDAPAEAAPQPDEPAEDAPKPKGKAKS